VAISISTWRAWLSKFCIPEFSDNIKSFDTKETYHTLIDQPLTTELSLSNGNLILLTGSNISGKTTFILTIGINALLAQTVNTACASTFTVARFKIYTALRIKDNLVDDTSYYHK